MKLWEGGILSNQLLGIEKSHQQMMLHGLAMIMIIFWFMPKINSNL